jgi:hypothetical protein
MWMAITTPCCSFFSCVANGFMGEWQMGLIASSDIGPAAGPGQEAGLAPESHLRGKI